VLTTDFFTPIVDDPYTFGAVSSANALSDIYSMGGKPLASLSISAFPSDRYSPQVLTDIIQGAIDKCAEGGCVLIGGHTVEDRELKFGLAVTGQVHPRKIITRRGAKLGDALVLTKPLGTGIINTAVKGNMGDDNALSVAIENMLLLNAGCAEVMREMGVICAMDVTGFGLLGHALELAKSSDVALHFHSQTIPIMPKAEEFASLGLMPGGLICNREYVGNNLIVKGRVSAQRLDLLFDPQTSGGMLISISPKQADELVERLQRRGYPQTSIVGEVVEGKAGGIIVS